MGYVWLLPFWLASLLFSYQNMQPSLNLDLGIRISPDRLIFLAILGWFLRSSKKRPVGSRATERLMLAFALLCTISWLVARPDAEGLKLRWLNTIFQLAYFPFLTYYICKQSEFSERSIRHILNGIVVIQTYLVIIGLAEYYEISWLVWPSYVLDKTLSNQPERLTGTFSNSSILGAALVMNFGCLCLLSLYSRGLKRVYLFLLMVLSAACIYFTHTRTVWIGLFVVLLVFYFSRSGLSRIARNILLGAIVLALSGVTSKFSIYRATLFSQRQETVEYRLLNLQAGWQLVRQYPFFGVGYGAFGKHMATFEEDLGLEEKALSAGNENTWLGIAVELGLIGLALYCLIFARLVIVSFAASRSRDQEQLFVPLLATVSLALMLYILINWSTGDLRFHLYDPSLAFMFQGILASCLRQKRIAESSQDGLEADPECETAFRLERADLDGGGKLKLKPLEETVPPCVPSLAV